MNKSELIEKLAARCELGQLQAEDIVKLLIDKMRGAMLDGKRIEIRGFGSFVVRPRRARWGRNPKTGGTIWVKAKNHPQFKLGKELRDRLNGLEGGE